MCLFAARGYLALERRLPAEVRCTAVAPVSEPLPALGVYCTVKGFLPWSPILRAGTGAERVAATPAVAPG